jgi:hypothetical protein
VPVSPAITVTSASPDSRNPVTSSRGERSAFVSGTKRQASAMPTMPTGTLIQKIQRQSKYVVMKPPSGGPTSGPTSAGMVR